MNKNKYSKNYRKGLISIDRCPGHPNRPVVLGRKQCQQCIDYQNNNRKQRLLNGKCPHHTFNNIVFGSKECQECKNKRKEKNNSFIKDNKCPHHPKNDLLPNKKYCKLCKEYGMKYYNRIKSNKKCRNHPTEDLLLGRSFCKLCKEQDDKNNKLWDNFIISKKFNMCSKCGYHTYIGAINFHHINPKIKDYKLSVIKHKKFSQENIVIFLNEVKKCKILCTNCHREIHSKCIVDYSKILWNKYSHDKKIDICSTCGYNNCIDAIEAHHINPEEKEFNISDLKKRKFTLENIEIFEKELLKCKILCSNCHRECHNGKNKYFKELLF